MAKGYIYHKRCILLPIERKLMMKKTNSLGTMLLAVWLVLTGLAQFVEIPIPSFNLIMAAIAIAAGVLMFMNK